jgi:hypothetical protein
MYGTFSNAPKIKDLVARCNSFFIICIHTQIESVHSSITFAELHSICFIAVRSIEGLRWGAEPRIELGAAAVQQPDALTELRRA